MFDLHGDVAVVTGAGTGLGRQFALALARQGASVALLGRRQSKLDAVAEEIRALGAEAFPVSTDVTDPTAVEAARDRIVEKFGKVTILVNDAGGGIAGSIESLSDEDWQKNRALDFDGVFYCMEPVVGISVG